LVKVDISQIAGRDGESQTISLLVNSCDIGETEPWFAGPISVSGQIVNVGESYRLMFHLTGSSTMECSRCLKSVDQAIDFDVDDQVEAEDVDLVNGVLDIGEIVRAALAFHQPMQPLCDEACKGFCAHCGIDLNQAECDCDKALIDPRLAALGRLLEK